MLNNKTTYSNQTCQYQAAGLLVNYLLTTYIYF